MKRNVDIVARSIMVEIALDRGGYMSMWAMRNIANGVGLLNMVGFAFIHPIMFIAMDMVLTSVSGVEGLRMTADAHIVQRGITRNDSEGVLALGVWLLS